jgi:hypothetical protein
MKTNMHYNLSDMLLKEASRVSSEFICDMMEKYAIDNDYEYDDEDQEDDRLSDWVQWEIMEEA